MKKMIQQLCCLVLIAFAAIPLQAQITHADSTAVMRQRAATTGPSSINIKRLRPSAEFIRHDFESLQQGEYSVVSVQLSGSSAPKDYYVKKIGSKLYLNGDIIIYDYSIPRTLSYSRNDEKHTFILDDLYRWPGGVVPVVLDKSVFESDYYITIKSAIDYFHYNTGIVFKERTNEPYFVNIICVDNDGKRAPGGSPVGRQKNSTNPLELTKGQFTRGTVLHELMHALGMYHEQSRPDRDNYVEIKWDNIKSAAKYNYQIEGNGTQRSAYDYCSIMHYGAMSGNAIDPTRPVIVCKNNGAVVACPGCIGSRDALSKMDLDGLDALYREIGVSRFPCYTPFNAANVPISGCIGVTDRLIVDKWNTLRGALGDCTSGLIYIGNSGASMVQFEDGAIYHSARGIYAIYGNIHKLFKTKGVAYFGFPISDEENIPGIFAGWRGLGYTRVSKFENRTIIWGQTPGAKSMSNKDYATGPLTKEQLRNIELKRTEPIRLQH